MRVVTVLGARPQFIKAAPVSKALRSQGITEIIVHTGQHYDPRMSQVFFDELGIPEPDANLHVGSGELSEQLAKMLIGLDGVLRRYNPDGVLVYGDTNSTLAGAIAAANLLVPVAHVEAGLRSYNRRMPEERNRIVTDSLSSLLLVPTETAFNNLRREGIESRRIINVGDVMYDAALHFARRSRNDGGIVQELSLAKGQYILATVHRAENTDDVSRLEAIWNGLELVGRDIPVVWPVHPRTRKLLQAKESIGVQIIDPVGYLDMLRLEENAALIVTDSGGVQKEAFFHRVPCVTLRDETEWTELVDLNWNRLCPPNDPYNIHRAVLGAIGSVGQDASPYGDGNAAARIACALGNGLALA